jgi:hypothetical protein
MDSNLHAKSNTAVGFHSDTYNEGDAFIAPLPIAGYEWRRVTLNIRF